MNLGTHGRACYILVTEGVLRPIRMRKNWTMKECEMKQKFIGCRGLDFIMNVAGSYHANDTYLQSLIMFSSSYLKHSSDKNYHKWERYDVEPQDWQVMKLFTLFTFLRIEVKRAIVWFCLSRNSTSLLYLNVIY